MSLLTKVFGTKNERELKKIDPLIPPIGEFEAGMKRLSDEQLRARTGFFREKIDQGASLDDLLQEAFAVVREASWRVLNMRHFDTQLIGGLVLHHGKIAEMKTGEGKTLVATLPVYLNGLSGKGVHVVTVNDYLARRDSEWMGRVYRFLGLEVGVIQHDMDDARRQKAYRSDVTYGTNNEFGFDYLRDNMKFSLDRYAQNGHNYAIVDEVDSILIDEARTPLIISGPSEDSVGKYYEADRMMKEMIRAANKHKTQEAEKIITPFYEVDEKARTAVLTDEGVEEAERRLGLGNLYDPANLEILHCLEQSLKAHTLQEKDVHYMIKDGQVVIVDEFTGRLMSGRRWSDGLHQAVEAKEGVKIEKENQTLATITFQNYFRMYDKLAGMTGTADTEAVEFDNIYKLEVMVIPTNRPLLRTEFPDLIYRTEKEKYNAVIDEIQEGHERGQPSLVGTISIEKSEHLSGLLKKRGVPHVVLNAKYHEQEANIVAQAGRVSSVTIATNMAGRGTDILLGGNPEFLAEQILANRGLDPQAADEAARESALAEAKKITDAEHDKVIELGGLHIIGTERHESRRIDNQLRGRAGRQGDPGSSRFYLSLEDDLMRIFGSDRISGLMQKLGMEEGVPIEHGMVSKAIERSQKQVEERNFNTRKHLLEYDDVMNKQREQIYELRREALGGEGTREYVMGRVADIMDSLLQNCIGSDKDADRWDIPEFQARVKDLYGIDLEAQEFDFKQPAAAVAEGMRALVLDHYTAKEARVGAELLRQYERYFILNVIDTNWKNHLLAMDHLKEGIGLRGYGQRDPLVEYKRESFDMFGSMKERVEDEIIRYLYLFEPKTEADLAMERRRQQQQERELIFAGGKEGAKPRPRVRKKDEKVGRNKPCPCGSGKKYKKCCGAA
ncbi:MAG: preprotein translocase subunit SecA [Acidobacteria bacterium]|nr:preprotein translocase subunit SecA [Acidobacteriota bacterium]